MNLSLLSFRIKKNIQKTNPSNNNYYDKITEGRVEMDYNAMDADQDYQRPTLAVFFDAIQKNSDAEHRARSLLPRHASLFA